MTPKEMDFLKDIVLVFIPFADWSRQHQIFDFFYARLPYIFFPYLIFMNEKLPLVG